ncbi:MAG: TerB family tellurite resistance protein [Ahrensia sp.]|nr:TerB family tellurite resistance protein [Ahrensia sp.]
MAEQPHGILGKLRHLIEKEKTVRLVAGDPTLTAELLLLFRMILADGQIKEAEMSALKRICAQEFGLNPDAMEGVYTYLQDFAYETTSTQSAEMFSQLSVERRQVLLNHMIAIAEADEEINSNEMKLLGRTASILGFDLKTKS